MTEKYKTLAECEVAIQTFKNFKLAIPEELKKRYEELKKIESSDTPIYNTLVANYAYGVMPQEKKDAIESTVAQLLEDGPNAEEPGLLLGKIQCGKTDTFESIIGLAFDKGIDICVVFTKGTKPLTQQTISRMKKDYRFFKASNNLNQRTTINIYDIMDVWKNISHENIENGKTVIVCKKQAVNLDHLMHMFEKFSFLKQKKVLIVDDEADFASRNYRNLKMQAMKDENGKPVEQEREIDIAVISRQIDDFRGIPSYCRYLQVTATPYSLYLQPNGELNLSGTIVKPFRPRFTTLVPTHERYVGGYEYFELSENEDSMYSHLYHKVSEVCIDILGRVDKRYLNRPISSGNLYGLTWTLMAYFMATAIRRIQESKNGIRYQSSALFHVEIDKKDHRWQQKVIERLITSITNVVVNKDYTDKRIWQAIDLVYTDFEESNEKGRTEGLISAELPTKEEVIAEMGVLLNPEKKCYTVKVVNSDEQVQSLLDAESGELELTHSANLFIGGNILDRGITIRNMLCFFYGRNPKKFQQDTVMQHARMYGARSKEDMAVTRLHTTDKIYTMMKQMNDNDNQLREWFISGKDLKYDNAICIAYDSELKPCAASKIAASDARTVKGNRRMQPIGIWTKERSQVEATMEKIDQMIEESAAGQTQDANGIWIMSSTKALEILELIGSTYEYSKEGKIDNIDHKDDIAEMRIALTQCTDGFEGATRKVYVMLRTDRRMSRIRTNGTWSNKPDNGSTEYTPARLRAVDAPALMLFRQNGKKEDGWNNTPFYWPVLVTQNDINPSMFALGQRKNKTLIPTDDSDILEGIDRSLVLNLIYKGDMEEHFGPEGTVYDDEECPYETRALKETTASLYLEKNDNGEWAINPDVRIDKEHWQGLYSRNNFEFPFVLRPYKYMLLRDKRNATANLMLLELHDTSKWLVEPQGILDENGDLTDRDTPNILVHATDELIDKDLNTTLVRDDTVTQWIIAYTIKKVLKYRKNAADEDQQDDDEQEAEETIGLDATAEPATTANQPEPSEQKPEPSSEKPKAQAKPQTKAAPQTPKEYKGLTVHVPSGQILCESTDIETYCKALHYMGLVRVRKLNIIRRGVNIVSTSKDPVVPQTKFGSFYIYNNMSTADKRKMIDKIAQALGEDIYTAIIE